ncbi:hypothetical protein I3842_15G164200 [Carya illinoinensis]|uniref:Uncharacterized protein n=1 Tax=Carya illinoinensis TaxID=32201 RepID=A0A922AFE4_CARIL|nr:hypothetical protein I3842_15G164200 [Carya illinoinensis]
MEDDHDHDVGEIFETNSQQSNGSTLDAVRQTSFGIGEELIEDDNPNDQDQRHTSRPVRRHEQHRRLGKTVPVQQSSTSDTVRQAGFGNIGHEEATAFGIGHKEVVDNFGIGHEQAAAFGIGEEFEDHDNPNEERRPRVSTREQTRKLGKTFPEHAIRINKSTSDVVHQTTFGNIGYEEATVNFGIGHVQATTFGMVHEEVMAFGLGGEEDGNPNEERRPRVQTCDQGKKSRTIVPECAIRINDNETQKPIIISGSGWSTLKVPAPMFKVDKGAYIPKIVSIGPFHYNEPSLRAMQTQKRRFLDRLIRNRTGQLILEESLKNAMRELEEKTRDFYAEDFQAIKPDDFVQMMLIDGCFIVELLRLYEKKYEGEPIFETRWTLPNISRDLLLLENQLPMFVLQKIFELTTLKGEASPDLNTLALGFFEPLRPGKDEFEKFTLHKHANGEHIHLLALFHSTLTLGNNICIQQPAKSEKKKIDLMLPGKGWVHNAKTLHYAGIQFKNNSGSILDIKLKGKTLKIPTMIIDDSTGPLLRNLIAYEQNNRSAAPYFCCLAVFLDSVVDTVEDVKILRDAGIIKQAKGGDEEVANLFNSLTKELVFDIDKEYCYMTQQIENINRLCRAHDTRVYLVEPILMFECCVWTSFSLVLVFQ